MPDVTNGQHSVLNWTWNVYFNRFLCFFWCTMLSTERVVRLWQESKKRQWLGRKWTWTSMCKIRVNCWMLSASPSKPLDLFLPPVLPHHSICWCCQYRHEVRSNEALRDFAEWHCKSSAFTYHTWARVSSFLKVGERELDVFTCSLLVVQELQSDSGKLH